METKTSGINKTMLSIEKVRDALKSDVETVLASLTKEEYETAIKSVVRGQASVVVIGAINKGNPAFTVWSKRLSYGEKLPRGKYFRKQEASRFWSAAPIAPVTCTTIHIA